MLGKGRKQGHQCIDDCGLAAAGGADKGGAVRVDGATVAAVKRPPVEDIDGGQKKRRFALSGKGVFRWIWLGRFRGITHRARWLHDYPVRRRVGGNASAVR